MSAREEVAVKQSDLQCGQECSTHGLQDFTMGSLGIDSPHNNSSTVIVRSIQWLKQNNLLSLMELLNHSQKEGEQNPVYWNTLCLAGSALWYHPYINTGQMVTSCYYHFWKKLANSFLLKGNLFINIKLSVKIFLWCSK